MPDYIKVGKLFYNTKRLVVFVARCLCHNQQMERLHQFFSCDALLAKVAEENPFVYEQPTRVGLAPCRGRTWRGEIVCTSSI